MSNPQKIILFSHVEKQVNLIKKSLDQANYQLIVCKNLKSIQKQIKAGAQILIVDTSHDTEQAINLCTKVRNNGAQSIGIIAIIEGSTELVADLINASVDDIIIAPFSEYSLLARINAQLRRIMTAEQLAFKIRDSWTLIEITSKLVGSNDLLDSLFDMVHILARELSADRASVVLVRPEGDLGLVIASSDDQEVNDLIINLESYPEIKQVVSTAQPLIVHDVSDSRVLKGVLPALINVKIESVALFPIIEGSNVLGVIFLRYLQKRENFYQRELVFCQTVANATSIALRNHEITESLRKKDQMIRKVETEARSRLAALQPYEDFFMGSMDGMVVLSNSGVIVFVNPEATNILNQKEIELRGLPFQKLLSDNELSKFEALVLQSESRNRIAVDLHFNYTLNEEVSTKIISTAAALLGTEGMILLTMRDVTEERVTARRLIEAKEQLIKTEKQAAIMEVAGAAAHELNQPLTSILTSLAMFKRILNDEEGKATRILDAMETEVDRMASIIKQLSKLTQYTTKEYVGQSKIVDLEKATAATTKDEVIS